MNLVRRLNERDNVALSPRGGACGERAKPTGGTDDFSSSGGIPPGHKVATVFISAGDPVLKNGHAIGVASRDIVEGEWVHTHNVCEIPVTRNEGLRWESPPVSACIVKSIQSDECFRGYRRERGRPGTRNDLWVVPTAGCAGERLRGLLRDYHKPYWIDSMRLLEHSGGCLSLGDDLSHTPVVLSGLTRHPNAAGVLVVGLGCEDLSVSTFMRHVAESSHWTACRYVKSLTLQEEGDARGQILSALDEMACESPRVRQAFPISDLCVGVVCSATDGTLIASPLLGWLSDYLVARGGSVLATVIPAIVGAEEALLSRIIRRKTYDDFMALDRWFRSRAGSDGRADVFPDGITTRRELALGALAASGSAPVTQVLRYGEGVRAGGGVQFTFGPADASIACTSLAASGAQLILGAAGVDAFEGIVPTIRLPVSASFPARGRDVSHAGVSPAVASWEDVPGSLARLMLEIASGARTAGEREGFGEIAIFAEDAEL